MDRRLHKRLLRNTEDLRSLVAKCSTESVVGACATRLLAMMGKSPPERSRLNSPFRQVFFLLGLMLSTPEPASPRDFGEDEWHECVDLLNAVESTYALMFWPTPEELSNLTEGWHKSREVAMPAFLHYIGTSLLASVEQVAERIRRYVVPFDAEVCSTWGLTASDALAVTDWIAQELQSSADQLLNLSAEALTAAMGSFLRVSHNAVQDRFGEALAVAYWRQFTCRRGETPGFRYVTESNVAGERPLFEIAEGVALCVSVNAIYEALLRTGEELLSKGERRSAFLKSRDRALETETEEKMRSLFGTNASFFARVYETRTRDFEHDLIIQWDRRLFVIEAKAAPPEEPFRDPDKAFIRLRCSFQSDTGIQKAYEQASRIQGALAAGNAIDLYGADGEKLAHISASDIDRSYCICVTRDGFGPLATDLSLLLQKDVSAPYPWATNITDLGTLLDAWDYFDWGPEKLCEYLDGRAQLHGRVFASDEMEIAGCFIKHGGFPASMHIPCDRLVLDPSYSSVFDEVYVARNYGGKPVEYEPSDAFTVNMREAMADPRTGKSIPTSSAASTRKQGRNELCACGCGMKYKRCCGRRR